MAVQAPAPLAMWSSLLLCCLHGDCLWTGQFDVGVGLIVDEGEFVKGMMEESLQKSANKEMKAGRGAEKGW